MKFFNLMIPLALTQIKMQLNVTMSNQAWRVDVDGKVEHEKTRIENSSIVDDMRRNMLGIVQDVQDTKEILANNSDLLTLSGNDEYRELHTVAYNGHKDIVQSLLDRGADVNAKDSDGWTALHWAAYNGYEEIVKALVRAGANVDTKNNRGETALQMAKSRYYSMKVKKAIKEGKKRLISLYKNQQCQVKMPENLTETQKKQARKYIKEQSFPKKFKRLGNIKYCWK